MIVEIENGEGSGKNELCICEFQGEITGELKGNDLGCMTLLENGKAEIGIGLHQLEGQIVTLKLPFLVLEKKRKHIDTNDEKESKEEQEPTMKVLGIARKKILFKSRPKNSNSLKK